MLTGMVPQLAYDGFVLGESQAIASFLGKKFDLAGKDDQEAARCQMVLCLVGDFMSKGGKVRFEKDEEKKKALKADFEEKNVPQFIGLMEKLVKDNDGKHLVGSKVSSDDQLLVIIS